MTVLIVFTISIFTAIVFRRTTSGGNNLKCNVYRTSVYEKNEGNTI